MKKIIYSGLITFLSVTANAQTNFGIATSNWSGMSSLYLNPANIANSNHKFVINVISATAGVDNNAGSLSTQGGLISAINNGDTKNIFNYGGSSKVSAQAPYAQITGPGFMMSINNKHSIALTTGIRGMSQFNNFDRSLFQAISDQNGNHNDFTSSNFNYTAHVWSEIGLSYGAVIIQDGNSMLKGGITLRYLGGIGYVGLRGDNLDAHYNGANNSFSAYNSDITYSSNVLTADNALNNGFSNNSIASQFFGSKAGSGMGADLGLVYEFTPDNRRGYQQHMGTGYLLRFSGSVLDLGSITYKAQNNSSVNATGNGVITADGIANNVRSFDDFRNYVASRGFKETTTSSDTKLHMPTRLMLSADYNVYSNLYVNASFVGNMVDTKNFGSNYYDQLTITPRFDISWVSIGVPVSYSWLSHSVKAGLGVRVSGFFVGSDDMLALMAKNQYGFNFYAGGFVPLNKRHWLDTDHDGVPDYKDKCPNEPGSVENGGCPEPDAEHGGSNDSEDSDNNSDVKEMKN